MQFYLIDILKGFIMKRLSLLMMIAVSFGVHASENRMARKEIVGLLGMTIANAAKYPATFMLVDVFLRGDSSTFSDVCIKFGTGSMITYGVSRYGYDYAQSFVKKENHHFAVDVSNNVGFGLGIVGVGLYYKI